MSAQPVPLDSEAASRLWRYRVLPTLTFMASAVLVAPPAKPEDRCMVYRCRRKAVLLLTAMDESVAAHTHPVRLCQGCCHPDVDIFRWLSDGQIEASQR